MVVAVVELEMLVELVVVELVVVVQEVLQAQPQ
jgi:hypothetical protein